MNKYSLMIQWSEADNAFIATVPELPGLSAFGKTPAKAVEELSVAQKLYIETMKEDGEELPEPDMLSPYSGQFRVRIPKTLHASLSTEAKKEGVSLNTYVVSLLSERNALNQIKKEIVSSRSAVFGSNVQLTGVTGLAGNYALPFGSRMLISANVAGTLHTIGREEEWPEESDQEKTNLH